MDKVEKTITVMTKEYILQKLIEENTWITGQSEKFIAKLRGGKWEFTIRREEDIYMPYKYSLCGTSLAGCGTGSRRYTGMDKLFLHILNNLNENADIKNKYDNLNDWLLGK